jgi:hypothetical protein
VSNEHTRRAAEGFDQLRHIVGELVDAIRFDAARLGRIAVAAQIGSDGAKAGRRERTELSLPRMARFGKAVKEDDERAVALLVIVQSRG